MAKSKKGTKASLREKDSLLPALLCAAVIAILTWFVFSPSLQNDFTNWDDPSYITDNPLVVNTAVPVKEIFKTPVSLNYHPITILTLAWNYQSGKLNPVGYHLENVILHMLNTLLVFFFIYLLTRRNLLMAAFVALFFGIHPMHVESVSWISERKDVLYVFFFLPGLISYLQYRQSGKVLWYVVTLILFVLSCLSKGMAVVFPVILFLIDYFQNVKWQPKVFIEKVPFFLSSIAFGIPAYIIQSKGIVNDMQVFSFPQRLLFACYGTVMYMVKLILPINLSALYPYPILNLHDSVPTLFYFFPVILIVIVALVYIFLRKEKPVVFGLLFYFVSVVLVLQFITVGNAVMADRYSYLSYIGLLFVAAYLFNKVWNAKTGQLAALRWPLGIVVVVGVIIFSAQTNARTQVWKNSETLWTDVINKYPNSYRAYETRGQYYAGIGEEGKAFNDFKTAIQLNPNFKFTYVNRGVIYLMHKQYDLAFADFNKAISIDSLYTSAYANKAVLYYDKTQFDSAIYFFSKSIRLDPDNDQWYGYKGQALMSAGKYADAVNCFSQAIQINNSASSYWYNRSRSENMLGKRDAAKADAVKAQQLGMEVDANYLKELGLN